MNNKKIKILKIIMIIIEKKIKVINYFWKYKTIITIKRHIVGKQ